MAAAVGGPEEGVGESSSPPRDPALAASTSGGSGRGGGHRGICREVFDRLFDNGHAAGPDLRAQLEAHFARFPTSYQLDLNFDKAEDHDRRPSFAVCFLRLEEVNADETTSSDAHDEGPDVGGDLSIRSKTSYTHMHEIVFSTRDKPKLPSQLSAMLSNIGLNVRKAQAFSIADGYSLDIFVVDGWPAEDADGLHKALEASMLRNEGSWSGSESSDSGKSLPFLAQDIESDIDTRLLKIVNKVTSGSCGDMFLGTYSGEEVAVKVLSPDNLNQTGCNEFRQEIDMLREVDHPNIVQFNGSYTKPRGAILGQTGGNVLDLDFGKCTGTSRHYGRAYIHYRHSIIQRLCEEQDHLECLFDEEGPTPVLQLTFHTQFSCDIECCWDLDTYFRKKSPVRFIPNDKLIEESDGAKGVLSNAGQTFLASLLRIVQANLMLGFSMGPSLERKDVVASGTTGDCMLLSAKCFRRDKSVTAARISYSTATNFFESLLKDTEGHDILDRLCESVTDLLSKMRWNSEPELFKSSLIQELILHHPAIMGTEGYIYLMRKADLLLRRQFKFAGSILERQVSAKVLSKLPYLSPESNDYWAHIAERHRLLAHWYNFRVNISKGYASNSLISAMFHAKSIKEGREASSKLEKAGSGLVALHRDAVVNHPFEASLKQINGMEHIRPLNMEYIVDVLTVNYSMYPVRLLENVSLFGRRIWDKFTLDMCFPQKPQSNEVWNTKIHGLQALMMKVGRRFR